MSEAESADLTSGDVQGLTLSRGLKSGGLLGIKLGDEELVREGLDAPTFSPNLAIWRTSLNSKYLVTGSLGINPHLVERKNIFLDMY
mgnify:CR=1 FL=1